ncbi:MAG: hypothetical protein AB7N76_19570 [Planctomycetota bacterium]
MRFLAIALTATLFLAHSAAADDPKPGDAPQEEGKKDEPKPEGAKPDGAKPDGAKPEGGKPAEGPKDEKEAARQKAREERRKKQEEAQAKRQARRNGGEGRELAPDEPEAAALKQLLTTDARYAKDGTVALLYDFKAPEQVADFDRRGFDAADREQGFGRGKGRAKRMVDAGPKARTRMELAAGSNGGLLLHKLELEDEFTVRCTLQVMRMTSRSDLVLFVGKGGVRFGAQLVSRAGSSFHPVGRGPLGREPFEKGSVVVTLTAKDGELKVAVDGVTTATTEKLKGKLDGQVGLFARDMLLYVYEVEIKGRPDPNKLLKKVK